VQVIELTLESPADVQHAVATFYGEQLRPSRRDLPTDPPAYTIGRWLHGPAFWPGRVYYVLDGASVVGVLEARYPIGPDNGDRIDAEVDAQDDRPDVENALVGTLIEMARELGRDVVGIEALRGSGFSASIERRGGKLAAVEEWNVIRLASAPVDDIRGWAAAPAPDGYSLITWSGRTPDEWMADQVVLLETMNTAPRDDLSMEDIVWNEDRVRQGDQSMVDRGIDLWTACARHDESGRLVAFTALEVGGGRDEIAGQNDTAVVPAHRGHGLGRWIKAANLVRVLDERPNTIAVETWNSTTNAHMIAVNRELGAQCEAHWEEWEIDREKLAATVPA
jgi:GNAT superfamily N-acetyltransferase